MKENFNFHEMNPLENMMLNIQNEGQDEVWNWIESLKNPLERCQQRKLYWQALEKMLKGK